VDKGEGCRPSNFFPSRAVGKGRGGSWRDSCLLKLEAAPVSVPQADRMLPNGCLQHKYVQDVGSERSVGIDVKVHGSGDAKGEVWREPGECDAHFADNFSSGASFQSLGVDCPAPTSVSWGFMFTAKRFSYPSPLMSPVPYFETGFIFREQQLIISPDWSSSFIWGLVAGGWRFLQYFPGTECSRRFAGTYRSGVGHSSMI